MNMATARPIERAARAARIPAHAAHRVQFGGPALLQFDDEDFVAALRGLVAREAWPERGWPPAIAARALSHAQPPQTLHQPVHRRFNLALADVYCEAFGRPGLDPGKIAAAALVVRRYTGPRSGDAMAAPEQLRDWRNWQGWFEREGNSLGWRPFASAAEFDADPDAAQRPAATTGNAVVDALIAQRTRGAARAERTHPLHALPPDTQRAAGRTLLFGLVPVTSEARAYPGAGLASLVPAPALAQYGAYLVAGSTERRQLIEQLSIYLKVTTTSPLPRASSGAHIVYFDASWLRQEILPPFEAEFILMVRQLAAEFGAFDAGARAQRWRELLDAIPFEELRFVHPTLQRTPIPGYAFLRECARVLENPGDTSIRVRMPDTIGPMPEGFLDGMIDTAVSGFEAWAAATPVPAAPFDDPQALYAVRAFVRVQPERAGCPMVTAWSESSPLYRVAPWYLATGRLPVPIPLPPADRNVLRTIKPNAAFAMPPSIHSLFGLNNAQGLLRGAIAAPRGGITWVWQLSIPVMTICALVAMHIVLFLLDVVFRWIPFAKIVFPLPRRDQ
jgi:hypothetical protein